MKIYIAMPEGHVRDTFFTPRAKAMVDALGEVTYNTYDRQLTAEELRDTLPGVDVLIAGWGCAPITEEVLSKADSLKMIAYTGGTVAAFITDAVYEKGIIVLSGNEIFAESVAESNICYIMAVLREVPKYNAMMGLGGWHEPDFYNEGLMDKTVGIVGFGTTSRYLAKMLAPYHCELKISSGHLTQEEAARYGATVVSMDEIFETCDIISLQVAGTQANMNLVGEEQLKKMKDGALLVNTSRGKVVDEEALIREAETGRIRAALDVYNREPPFATNKLRYLPNVLTMPHMAGPTIDRRQYVTMALAKDIQAFIDGKQDDFFCQITASRSKTMSSR